MAGDRSKPTDPVDLNEVFRRCGPQVLRTLRRGFMVRGAGGATHWAYLEGAAAAEDVLMDAFRVLVEHVQQSRFDPSKNPCAYWMGIAKNRALKQLGKQGREVVPESMAHVPEEPHKSELERRAESLLPEALAELEMEEKEVVSLVQEGLRQKDIGAKLGKSRDQVQRIWTRALSKLRSYFREHGWDAEALTPIRLSTVRRTS